jgi:hypothetical protein
MSNGIEQACGKHGTRNGFFIQNTNNQTEFTNLDIIILL